MRWPPPTDWPWLEHSRQVHGPVHRWHVQRTGVGPTILLLHGAGASTHSWRDIIPILARDFDVIAVDLPGHGWSQLGAQRRSGLIEISDDLIDLCQQEQWSPVAIVGHSAGAAIALQMARKLALRAVVGINPALDGFEGLAGILFPVLAKVMAAIPFAPQIFAGTSGRPGRVQALLDSTGSQVDAVGFACYQQLVADPAHVGGTLQMMAAWNLTELLSALSRISVPTLFAIAERDETVPAKVGQNAAKRLPDCEVLSIPDYGHLVHEEAPEMIAGKVNAFIQEKMAAE